MEMEPRTLMAICIAVFALLAVAFALTGPSAKEKAGKRAAALSGSSKSSGRKSSGGGVDAAKERRKQVSDSLKALETRQKELNKKEKVHLPEMLVQAGFEISVRDFYMISAIVGLVMLGIGFLTGQAPWVTGAMGVVGFLGMPRWFLARARKKRQKKFLEEFSNAIDVIVRGVKSGLPVNECLKIISTESQSPVREEFHLLVEGIRMGLSLEQALDRMYKRVPISEVNFFAIVLIIQQQTGGNLAAALGNLSAVLRGRRMMVGKINALSMEAKASAAILAAMPFMVSGMVYLSTPDYLAPLFETQTGQFLLIGSGLWMLTGIVVMKNMINIKV